MLWLPSNVKALCKLSVMFLIFVASRVAQASPATFVTALPVATNQILARFNWNATFSSQDLTSFQLPFNIAYGLTARWTLFSTVTLQHESLTEQTTPMPRQLSSGGVGDTLLFARYTIYSHDTPNSTFRIAPLAGMYLPSGNNTLHTSTGLLPAPLQTGSGTVAPYAGIATGWNSTAYGFAADSTIRHNPITSSGISPGDEFRADAQGELRLWPLELPKYGVPRELWISIEENYQHDSLTHIERAIAPGSGGISFYQDAILEYATLHYEIAAGMQFPGVQDLNSASDVREKRQFIFFTEYYLSGFRGRKK